MKVVQLRRVMQRLVDSCASERDFPSSRPVHNRSPLKVRARVREGGRMEHPERCVSRPEFIAGEDDRSSVCRLVHPVTGEGPRRAIEGLLGEIAPRAGCLRVRV